MVIWESAPLTSAPALTIGRAFLAVAAVALAVYIRTPGRLWALLRTALRGPGLMLAIGGLLSIALVLFSTHTNGCQCTGGSYGLDEMSAWAALAVLAVIAEPKSAVTLLGAVGLGCVLAGILALAGVHSEPAGSSMSTRLLGTYGNPNFLAATQALALPLAIAALFVERGIGPVRIRWLAVAAIAVLIVTVFQTYSRSGLPAAAGGSYVTIVLLVPTAQRRRTALTLAAVGVIAGIVLYPSFARLRTDADFGSAIAAAREVDRSGWSPASTGVISAGPSKLENAGPDVLRVIGAKFGEGASFPLGEEGKASIVRVKFEARSQDPGMRFYYALEDNLSGAGLVYRRSSPSADWRRFALTWSPTEEAHDARVYFYLGKPGALELRSIAVTSSEPPLSRALPTKLLGTRRRLPASLLGAESNYVDAREGALRIAIDAFLSDPIRGIGWDRFPSYASSRSGVGAIATHDEFTRFAAELGLPGLIALAIICAAAAHAALAIRRRPEAPALLGMLVASAICLAFANLLEAPAAGLPIAAAVACTVGLAVSERAPVGGKVA